MKSIYVCAAALCFVAGVANAQNMGGTLGLSFENNADAGTSLTTLEGSLDMGLGGIGLQGDVAKRIPSSGDGSFALGAHAYANLGQTAKAGGFLAYDNRSGDRRDKSFGIEGKIEAADGQAFEVEAYAMRVMRDGGRSNFGAIGIDGKVGLGAGGALTAGIFDANDGVDVRRYSLGYERDLTPALTGGVGLENIDTSAGHDTILGLSMQFNLGNGATFSRRDYPQLVPGF